MKWKTAQEYLPTCYWLMKTEPDVFSIDDLIARHVEPWDGVRNYQARNFMRDHMRIGHQVLFYHSNIPEPAIVGTAEIVKEAEADPSAWDKTSRYFDAKASPSHPIWCMVTVGKAQKFNRVVTRTELRAAAGLAEMLVLRPGGRLSVQPVSAEEFQTILAIGQTEYAPVVHL